MKKAILPLIVLFTLMACNDKADKKADGKDTIGSATTTEKKVAGHSIVGKWKPVKVELPELNEENKQNLLDHTTLEFTADGSFITTMKTSNKTGTYQFNEQENTLMTKMTGGKDETFKVSWDNDLVELTNEEGKVTMKRQ